MWQLSSSSPCYAKDSKVSDFQIAMLVLVVVFIAAGAILAVKTRSRLEQRQKPTRKDDSDAGPDLPQGVYTGSDDGDGPD